MSGENKKLSKTKHFRIGKSFIFSMISDVLDSVAHLSVAHLGVPHLGVPHCLRARWVNFRPLVA